jgi:hypothetical protein
LQEARHHLKQDGCAHRVRPFNSYGYVYSVSSAE